MSPTFFHYSYWWF